MKSGQGVGNIVINQVIQKKARTCEDILRDIENVDKEISEIWSKCLFINNAPGREHWERGDIDPDLMVKQCQMKSLAERGQKLAQELTRSFRAK